MYILSASFRRKSQIICRLKVYKLIFHISCVTYNFLSKNVKFAMQRFLLLSKQFNTTAIIRFGFARAMQL